MTRALTNPSTTAQANPLNNSATWSQSVDEIDLEAANRKLDRAEASEVIQWGADTFGDRLVMSTSFGIQSAVMLGLVTSVIPNIPVIWVDTGYLPAETYRFAQQLTQPPIAKHSGLPIPP